MSEEQRMEMIRGLGWVDRVALLPCRTEDTRYCAEWIQEWGIIQYALIKLYYDRLFYYGTISYNTALSDAHRFYYLCNAAMLHFNSKRCKMKKTYSAVARFVRWVVAGILSFMVAVPTIASFGTSV